MHYHTFLYFIIKNPIDFDVGAYFSHQKYKKQRSWAYFSLSRCKIRLGILYRKRCHYTLYIEYKALSQLLRVIGNFSQKKWWAKTFCSPEKCGWKNVGDFLYRKIIRLLNLKHLDLLNFLIVTNKDISFFSIKFNFTIRILFCGFTIDFFGDIFR